MSDRRGPLEWLRHPEPTAGTTIRSAVVSQLYERLAHREQLSNLWPFGAEDFAQSRIRDVSARHPQDARWRSVPLQEVNEVDVLGSDDRVCVTRGGEYCGVGSMQKSEILDVRGIDTGLAQPTRERRWQLGVDPDSQCQWACHLRGEHRMIQPAGGILQAGGDVVPVEVREIGYDLIRCSPRR